jgi:hypothetical protein
MKQASRNETTIYNIALMDSLCAGRPGSSYVITAGVCLGRETSAYRTHATKCVVRIYAAGSNNDGRWML